MPVSIKKIDGKYQVKTPGGIKAKGTTLKKAQRQKRLLNALEHSPNFKPRSYKNVSQ